jgi:Tc5 transposase C-terminal domain
MGKSPKSWLRDRLIVHPPRPAGPGDVYTSQEEAVLLVDSWSGWKAPLEDECVRDKKIRVYTIPKGATAEHQPLDVFYNHPFKQFYRYIAHRVLELEAKGQFNYTLSTRKSIAKLLSLIHNQFCSPRFKDFIVYCFSAAGYYDERPPPFRTPSEYCLFDPHPTSKCVECGKIFVVLCAYCEQHLCLHHWLLEKHWCN